VTESLSPQRWRALAFAAAISTAAHAAIIAFGRLELPRGPADLPPLAVRIVDMREAVRAIPALPPSVAKRERVARVPVRPDLPNVTLPGPAPNAAAGDESNAAEPQAAEVAPGPPEPVVVATAPASLAAAGPIALPAFPRRGRITFNLVYGRDGFSVGKTEQSWQIDGSRYQLASRSETTGLADLLRSQHRTYLSRGELTPGGFRPNTFLMSRDRGRGVEEARAQFDWSQGSVRLGPVNAQRQEALPPGSQDLVSFMYQLALEPPAPGRSHVAVTNGSKLQLYELEVRAEEKIDTPLGVLRALPVRQMRREATESIELWLATEYRHLPVRIRFYGRDGEPAGEQVVTAIRLND
jgi:hypothetical protein